MKLIEFRYLYEDDNKDDSYPHWSRKWEYPVVERLLEKYVSRNEASIHNTSWGFDVEHHQRFKNILEEKYTDVVNSDIRTSNLPNTIFWDIRTELPKFENRFDVVLNISTVEEVNFDHWKIIKNLLLQVKPNGYLIMTFDLPGMNLNQLENELNATIECDENKVKINSHKFGLEVGLLVIEK